MERTKDGANRTITCAIQAGHTVFVGLLKSGKTRPNINLFDVSVSIAEMNGVA